MKKELIEDLKTFSKECMRSAKLQSNCRCHLKNCYRYGFLDEASEAERFIKILETSRNYRTDLDLCGAIESVDRIVGKRVSSLSFLNNWLR